MPGMQGMLKIKADQTGSRTILTDCYFEAPFKVAKPIYDGSVLELIVMSASAGVLEGDRYSIDLILTENACLRMLGQSFTKVFQMPDGGFAKQELTAHVAPGALLEYLPQPVIPFAGSFFESNSKLDVQTGGRLVYSDILSCGRYGSGEVFQFSRLRQHTLIRYNGLPVFLDNILLEPSTQSLSGIGFYEGHTHQGVLVAIDPQLDGAFRDDCRSILKKFPLEYGVTELAGGFTLIRALGHSCQQLQSCFSLLVQKYHSLCER